MVTSFMSWIQKSLQEPFSQGFALCAAGWAFFIPLDAIFILKLGLPSPSHFFFLGSVFFYIPYFAREVFRLKRLAVRLCLLLVILSCGLIPSIDLATSFQALLKILYYLFTTILVISACRKRVEFSAYILGAFGVGCLVSGVYSTMNSAEVSRLTLVDGYNPTWLGAHQVTGAFIFSYMATRSRALAWRMIGAVSALFCLNVAFLTQAQTALYSFIAGFCIFVLLLIRKSVASTVALVAGVVVLGATAAQHIDLSGVSNIERTLTCSHCSYDEITSGRTRIWREYVESESFSLLGVGFQNAVRIHGSKEPHNTYLTILFDLGIVGLVVFICLLLRAYLMVKDHPIVLSGLGFMVIFMAGNDMLYYKYAWVTGLVLALVYQKERWRVARYDVSPLEPKVKGEECARDLVY